MISDPENRKARTVILNAISFIGLAASCAGLVSQQHYGLATFNFLLSLWLLATLHANLTNR